jgi:hypothetical protein
VIFYYPKSQHFYISKREAKIKAWEYEESESAKRERKKA